MTMRRVTRPSPGWWPLAALAVAVIAGILLGTLIGGRLRPRQESPVSELDYVLLVSALYDHERILTNAQERMTILGHQNITDTVVSLAKTYPDSREAVPGDVSNLRQLAAALTGAGSLLTSAGVGTPSAASGSWIDWWFVLLMVLVVAVAAGWLLVQRGQPGARARGERRRAMATAPSKGRPLGPEEPRITTRPMTAASTLEKARPIFQRPPRAPTPQTPGLAHLSFEAVYRLGDDPFEEVHPIGEGESLVGACGLTATLRLDAPGLHRYYAFTAWVQDYLGDETVRAVGLVSKWGEETRPAPMQEWVRSIPIERVLRAERNLEATLETKNIAVGMTVLDFSYGRDSQNPTDSYFTNLQVKFNVTVKPTTSPT